MGELFEFNESFPKELGKLLLKKKLTLSVAESCSGGLISHRITQVPGSSKYYAGGVISYSNELKQAILGVQSDTLDKYGAVSEHTSLEMAKGIKKISGSDIACAVTGIAGPGGGSKEKPIGLVYIAVISDKQSVCKKYHFHGSRETIKLKTSGEAIKLIINFIEEYYLNHEYQ